jgi:hypothetical protein
MHLLTFAALLRQFTHRCLFVPGTIGRFWWTTLSGRKGWHGLPRTSARRFSAHLHAQTSAGPLHVGLLVADFPKCKHLTAAYRAVIKVGRSNFALPVLTMFRSKARGHNLLFLFSETSLQPQVGPLLERYDSLLGTDMRCSD